MSTITLSEAEREDFIREARREFVQTLIEKNADGFGLISRAQAGGILDVAPNTLASIPGLKPVELIPGKVVKYRLADIRALVAKKKGEAK